MKANEVTLNSFLSQSKTQFIIPVYQRNYDWMESQCGQLLNDILEVGQKRGETHFIGSIVFIHDGVYTSSEVKKLVVIDGEFTFEDDVLPEILLADICEIASCDDYDYLLGLKEITILCEPDDITALQLVKIPKSLCPTCAEEPEET